MNSLTPTASKLKKALKPKRDTSAIIEDFATLACCAGQTLNQLLEMTLASVRGMIVDELGKDRVKFALNEAKRRKGSAS